MKIEDIQSFLNENLDKEEVKDLIKSFQQPITRETVEAWTKEGEGRSWLDRACDLYSTKAVNTAREKAIAKFKETELPKILEEEFRKKSNDGLSDTEIALKDTQKQLEELQQTIKIKELESKYKDTLSSKGLDTRLMKFILSENEEDIENNINLFSEIISSGVQAGVQGKLNQSTYEPPASNPQNLGKITWEQVQENPQQFYSQWIEQNQ